MSECNHKRCDGGRCRSYDRPGCTILDFTEEDLAFAEELIFNGWRSVSNKFRTVANLPDDFPSPAQMVDVKMLGTRHGQDMMKLWKQHMRSALRTNDAITKDLTMGQFRAFKKLGGDSA